MAEIWEKRQYFLFKSWLLKLQKIAISIVVCNCHIKKLHKRYIKVVIQAHKLSNSRREKCLLFMTINRTHFEQQNLQDWFAMLTCSF